ALGRGQACSFAGAPLLLAGQRCEAPQPICGLLPNHVRSPNYRSIGCQALIAPIWQGNLAASKERRSRCVGCAIDPPGLPMFSARPALANPSPSHPEESEQAVGCDDAIALRLRLADRPRCRLALGIKQVDLWLHADADLVAHAVARLRGGKSLLARGSLDEHGGAHALERADRLFVECGASGPNTGIGGPDRTIGFGDLRGNAPAREQLPACAHADRGAIGAVIGEELIADRGAFRECPDRGQAFGPRASGASASGLQCGFGLVESRVV